MYLRPVFTETDTAKIEGLIEANPFGVLITHSPEGLEASHIPFLLKRVPSGFVLAAHLAAANRQCALLDGHDALAVFTGPHAYIAPGWYATQPAVPTWDYVAVHVSGSLQRNTDPAMVMADLQGMAMHDPGRFAVDAMPEDYRGRMLAGICAFTLTPKSVQAQWKMSQNRSITDRRRVIAALCQEADAASLQVADLIAQTLPA